MTASTPRLELAQRVFRTIKPSMDSVDYIGSLVASLLGAILIDTTLDFYQPITEQEDEFLRLISDLFGTDDEVWQYITVECDQLGNGCTCESCTRQIESVQSITQD